MNIYSNVVHFISIDLWLFDTFISVTGTAELIVTVGGEDDKVVLRSVESFDPTTSQWKSLACLPFAVSKHGLVVSGECLFMCFLVFSFNSGSMFYIPVHPVIYV